MTREEKISKAVYEALENMEDDNILWIWNDYCDDNGYSEYRLYPMFELDDLFCDCKVSDFLNAIDTDGFSLNDDYFHDSIYGLQSTSDIYSIVDIDDLAQYITDTENTFDQYELEEIFEEYEEDDEDEEDIA